MEAAELSCDPGSLTRTTTFRQFMERYDASTRPRSLGKAGSCPLLTGVECDLPLRGHLSHPIRGARAATTAKVLLETPYQTLLDPQPLQNRQLLGRNRPTLVRAPLTTCPIQELQVIDQRDAQKPLVARS